MKDVSQDQITLADRIANIAHQGQFYGKDSYMDGHISEVVSRVVYRADTESMKNLLKVLAYLHDVIEDSDLTRDTLVTLGIDWDIANMVDQYLTKRPGEHYSDYISRVLDGPREVILVKLADMECNLSASSSAYFRGYAQDVQLTRMTKYLSYLPLLRGALYPPKENT